jgi:predicted PurR-regulated permease PerM
MLIPLDTEGQDLGSAVSLGSDLKGALANALKGFAHDGKIEILGSAYSPDRLAEEIEAAARGWLSDPANLVFSVNAGFTGAFAIFLTAVILFYFMMSGREIVKSLVRLAPPRHRPLIGEILAKIAPLLRRYFAGVAIVGLYAAIAAYIGLGLILGLQHAVLLAIATGFLEMIPVAGPLLAAILGGAVALQGAASLWNVLQYVLYASALRLSIDQLFGPIVLGRAASLSPVTIIFCFLSGGVLYGIAGVILSVPVALSITIALQTIYGESGKTKS